ISRCLVAIQKIFDGRNNGISEAFGQIRCIPKTRAEFATINVKWRFFYNRCHICSLTAGCFGI
ncbi:hypothetical protein HK096_003628, partial [Nowakowskiella sp. JEL0078]